MSDSAGIRRLVLASGSPRRQQLFSLLGLPFVIKAANVDERRLDGEAPGDMVRRVSRAKADGVPGVRPDELVVAADTIVVLDDDVLGKPQDAGEAALMLRRLRGRAHVVYTGLCLWHPASGRMVAEAEGTVVWMRDYADAEIDSYVESGDPLDKAGAYAIQHPAFDPVSRVDGCWLNVMGMPLCAVGRLLGEFGVAVPGVPASCVAFNPEECRTALRGFRPAAGRGAEAAADA